MADTETLRSALQSVLLHVQHIDMSALDAILVIRLNNLARACTTLQAQLVPVALPAHTSQNLLDHATFDRLMDLAGPDTARDLLDRLVEDLCAVQHSLGNAQALPDSLPDWAVLRGQSHILIGLAGAVGAAGLWGMSQDLNTIANDQTQPALDPLLAKLMPTLADLIHFVQAQRTAALAAQ